MKALTVRQPHAALIVAGVQTIVTSTRPTDHRGRVAITAAKRWGMEHDVREHEWHGFSDSLCGLCRYEDALDLSSPIDSLPLGAVVGSAVLTDSVPILRAEDELDVAWMPHIAPTHQGELRLWHGPSTTENPSTGRPDWRTTVIEDQLPFADFSPGRWAWLLTDPAPTTDRCPWCWGSGDDDHDDVRLDEPDDEWPPCRVCDREGRCDPVPVRGRPGLWEWAP